MTSLFELVPSPSIPSTIRRRSCGCWKLCRKTPGWAGSIRCTASYCYEGGTYADCAAILSENELTPKPASISQRVLVAGGGGAVGLSAIQLAVNAGCHVSTIYGGESIDRPLAADAEQAVDYTAEDLEVAIKGHFDAVLDTIGVPGNEKVAINLLKRGGCYMTLQGVAASWADRYGVLMGLPMATTVLLKKPMQYRNFRGIEYR